MRRIQWILIIVTISAVSLFAADLELSGYVRNYSGAYVSDSSEFAILQNSFDLSMDYSSARAGLLANPYLDTDGQESADLDFRELYIDLYFDTLDLRIGRQQVIWGKGDGVFITDVVSPKNLGEFILPDFKEVRLGVNAAKVDYYFGGSTVEIIWVPLFTANRMPDSDSDWNSLHIDFSGSDDYIDPTFENSEIFFRYSLLASVLDLELVAASMWDDEPVLTSLSPLTFEHKRLAMGGGSFSFTLSDFILRGEGAYYSGKGFSGEGLTLLESDYIHYMGGLDYSLSGYNMSIQFIQRAILDYDDSMSNDSYENTMTFMINKSFLRETLTAEIFSYVEFADLNALIRPKVTYDFDDGFAIILGANYFLGDSGTYGQFDDNDMVYTQFKLSF